MTKRRRLQEPLTLETCSLSELISTLYESTEPHSVMNTGDIDQGCLQEKAVELQNVIQKLHSAIDAARQFSALQYQSGDALHLIKDVLDHSHRTSYTTGAPLGYVPGKSALYMLKPPAPQTAQFQNSILHTAFSQHEKPMYMEQHATAEKEKKQEEKNPLELLKQLPPMPKEWKPGDPIPGVEPVKKNTKEVPPSVDKAPKKPASNFAFSLNPDMDVEFDVADSSDDDSSSDDDY